MTSQLLPPNPCLVAILLVVNYHHQPRLIFHYPPRPGEDNSQFTHYLKTDITDDENATSSDDNSESSSDGHSSPEGHGGEGSKNKTVQEVDVEAGSASPEKLYGLASMRRQPKWDDVLGYGTVNLAKLLCPAPGFHKRRFEMSLNEKAFLGWPVFSIDGSWQKRKKKRLKREKHAQEEKIQLGEAESGSAFGKGSLHVDETPEETSGQDSDLDVLRMPRKEEAATKKIEVQQGSTQTQEEPYKPKKSKEEHASKDSLKMFHIVFVLDPPPVEFHLRMKEMYDHVVKKFSRALKWEQARSNYVGKEVSVISSASKGHHRTLGSDQALAPMYQQILSQSSLAKAISTLFNCISSSKIAYLHLTPASPLSLQIPIPTSTSILPSPIDPRIPGLWLTTARPFPADDDIDTPTSQLKSHFTLLLLSDLSSILSDVNATPSPRTALLTHYLRVSKPTLSFLQISQTSGIPLHEIRTLASHLIYWRRARAIPPIHQRDTYIISPNADMQKLASAISSFAKTFPNLPSLPKILNKLSFTSPRPYSALIPAKDHKEAYLDILAWLLRYGWVTQLRTFAWIRVPSQINRSVTKHAEQAEEPPTHEKERVALANAHTGLKPPPPNQAAPPSPSSSGCSVSTAFASFPSTIAASLIPDPRHASALPSRHLAAISTYVLEQQGKEVRGAWERCFGYFDGKHALEIIAAREGWKRKRVEELIAGWEGLGILVRARHW